MEKRKTKVTLLAIENQEPINGFVFNNFLLRMPEDVQQDILKYQRWQDRQATLLGKWLLIKGLEILDKDTNAIYSLQKDKYKRPFLESIKNELDFNISHSKGMVVCALSQSKVGIDVETMDNIIPSEYKVVFTNQEFRNIEESQNTIATFFKYWTKKEAIMKADGRGFYLSPASFEAIENEVVIENKRWYIQDISLKKGQLNYKCHIATNEKATVETYFFETPLSKL